MPQASIEFEVEDAGAVGAAPEELRRDGFALRPIGFHECRHTFASLMLAAGVNDKALQTFWATRRSP